MIVYEASKREFLNHVDQDVLVNHILSKFEVKLGRIGNQKSVHGITLCYICTVY
ncbi:hypothetical protein HNQ94_000043 [Salirhabdus euzebyi]|uniref:Uncharacterized protein n=1 Tax=Salirhabdus euzebyi TaxID=394506 RepID=A0A841Q160_9BACI|nr:hypothetical protein [Salirhabdus euzebyi]